MWGVKENGSCSSLSLLFRNLCLFLSFQFFSVWAQCEYGLEPSCNWAHDPKTHLLWKLRSVALEKYVELTKCNPGNCGNGIIQSPWLPPRDQAVTTTIHYKIYGTSAVFLRLNMELDDTMTPYQIFSKEGNYAYGYPKEWTSQSVTIPATHTRHKLILKAFLPYSDAMVAVKDINLDGTIIISSAESSSTSATFSKPLTEKPDDREEEKTLDESDYFPNLEDDDDEDGRRFQALQVEEFIREEDLTKGYTTVVEPQICMYK